VLLYACYGNYGCCWISFQPQGVCQFSPPLGNVEARVPQPGYPVVGSQLLEFGDTVINASAAITVDSTSIVYVGYTNGSGNFIGEGGVNRHMYTVYSRS